jgi:hypothetical protein
MWNKRIAFPLPASLHLARRAKGYSPPVRFVTAVSCRRLQGSAYGGDLRISPGIRADGGDLEGLGLFFLAPSPDYRYVHWMVVCAEPTG